MRLSRSGLARGAHERLERINRLLPTPIPADMASRPYALARQGYADQARGRRHEEQLIAAFAKRDNLPEWFRSIIQGTEAEDHAGIDAVLWTTDAGAFRIQVKSRKKDRGRFEKKHGKSIIVVVITDTMTDTQIRSTVLEQLAPLRTSRLARGVR